MGALDLKLLHDANGIAGKLIDMLAACRPVGHAYLQFDRLHFHAHGLQVHLHNRFVRGTLFPPGQTFLP